MHQQVDLLYATHLCGNHYSRGLTGFSLLAIGVEYGNLPFSFYFLTPKSSVHERSNHPFREERCKQGKLYTEGSNPEKMEECIKVIKQLFVGHLGKYGAPRRY